PPWAQRLESVPELRLRRLLVERRVDVRHVQRLNRRSPVLERAQVGLELGRERELERVQERERVLAHDDDELRLDDVQLANEEGAGLLVGLVRELEAVRPVHGQRVDVQPLERLEDRLARASEERDALLHLRGLRAML